MPQIDVPRLIDTLKEGVVRLATNSFTSYVAQVTAEGQKVIDDMNEDISRWAQQFNNGELSKPDMEDLAQGQVTSMKMVALKQCGMAKIEVDKFKRGLTDLITKTISALL